MANPAYDKLFSDPRFKTYLLTTTTTGAFIDTVYPWAIGFAQAEYGATRGEIAKLGDALFGNPKYAGKTFIILNWEADNEIILYRNKQTIWDAFVGWTNARADGVRDARGRNSASEARLYSGFECNAILVRENVFCGAPVADPIRVRLPRDLVFTKFTFAVVGTRDNLESSLYPLRQWPNQGIVPDCPSCAPAIRIKRGIVVRDDSSENFFAGTAVRIFGDRFSENGNAVIVEQGGRRRVAEKNGEAPGEFLATLPADLQPGFAIVYVTNSSGQESKAYALTISRSAIINRKPIRRGSRLGSFGTTVTNGQDARAREFAPIRTFGCRLPLRR